MTTPDARLPGPFPAVDGLAHREIAGTNPMSAPFPPSRPNTPDHA